jgi:hypothetical protein
MVLNDDQKLQIQEAVLTAGLSLPRQQLTRFVLSVETSIAAHLDAKSGDSPQIKRDLARLWQLAQEDDLPVGQIRAAIEKLSKGALHFIDRRLSAGAFLPGVTDFRKWARSAKASDLVIAARGLSSYGASWQEGRSRGSGKRSSPRLMPLSGARQRGGRPTNVDKFSLISFLALDWVSATGEEPKRGRDVAQGFGYLVHAVFGWVDELDEDDDSVHHALRQYWEAVKEGIAAEGRELKPKGAKGK